MLNLSVDEIAGHSPFHGPDYYLNCKKDEKENCEQDERMRFPCLCSAFKHGLTL